MNTHAALWAAAIAVTVGHAEEPVVRPGWDWRLPAAVQPTPYSGYITWGNRRFDPAITVRGLFATWAQLNPAPGVYKWERLEEQIRQSAEQGMRVGIHLTGVQREAVPDWVIEKYHPVVVAVPVLQDNQPWRISNVLPWQPDMDRAFLEFLSAFGKTGIAQRDEVVYGYIHGISASRGEEMFIRPIDLKQWQATTGVTAQQFADWLRRRIDAMCEAFKGVEYKLAVMFDGPLGPTPEFRAATAGLCDYSLKRGTGIRGGGIDFMQVLFNAPGWASSVDKQGYCVVDDDDPVIRERRYRGDENEEYGKYWEWRFGPVDGYRYRHRVCVLRGLQMQQNFQMVSPATLELDPDLNEYARIVQGYRRDDSPDAWAYLRECQPRSGTVKNIERWLIQRDVPGSQSAADERVDRYPLASDPPDRHYDHDARRTDIANGQSGLLFRLDRVFWSKPAPATVKVTYTDKAPTTWWLHYTDGNGQLAKGPTVRNVGDGARKTATFHLDSLSAGGQFPNDAAFRTWQSTEPADTAERVKNGDFAQGAESWSVPDLYLVAPDPDRPGKQRLEFSFKDFEDPPHVDQLVTLKKGVAYRLSASLFNAGERLKPCVRVAGMDWDTILMLTAERTNEWETVSGTLLAQEDGPVRVQLFGQGRQYRTPGQSGQSIFRDLSLKPVPLREALDVPEMDFRLETDGPGDVTVTMMRVVKGRY